LPQKVYFFMLKGEQITTSSLLSSLNYLNGAA
jgi:hypothetical protein